MAYFRREAKAMWGNKPFRSKKASLLKHNKAEQFLFKIPDLFDLQFNR